MVKFALVDSYEHAIKTCQSSALTLKKIHLINLVFHKPIYPDILQLYRIIRQVNILLIIRNLLFIVVFFPDFLLQALLNSILNYFFLIIFDAFFRFEYQKSSGLINLPVKIANKSPSVRIKQRALSINFVIFVHLT